MSSLTTSKSKSLGKPLIILSDDDTHTHTHRYIYIYTHTHTHIEKNDTYKFFLENFNLLRLLLIIVFFIIRLRHPGSLIQSSEISPVKLTRTHMTHISWQLCNVLLW